MSDGRKRHSSELYKNVSETKTLSYRTYGNLCPPPSPPARYTRILVFEIIICRDTQSLINSPER